MPQPHRPLAAALWMLAGVTAFLVMAVAGRAVSDRHDTFEIMLYRSLTGVVLVLAWAAAAGTLGQVSLRRPRLQLTRNLIHFAGQNLWLYAITVLPLAQVFALEFTAPLWVLLLSPLLLGEPIRRRGALAAAVGFVGIMIVARPGPASFSPGLLAAALAALSFALTAILTRRLTQTETITGILIWLTCTQALFGLLAAGLDGSIALPRADTAPWLLLIGLAGLAGHLCLTTALSLAPAGLVMTVDFVRLPLAAVLGMLFYAEALDLAVFVGALLILGANWLNLTAPADPSRHRPSSRS